MGNTHAQHPVYLRIAHNAVDELYGDSYVFEPGKARVLREGQNLTIISSGLMIHTALAVASALSSKLDIRVVNLPSLKPVDEAEIRRSAEQTRVIVTLEDHEISGGVGSIVSEVVAESGVPAQVLRIGLDDQFIESGTQNELEEASGLDAHRVAKRVLEFVETSSQ